MESIYSSNPMDSVIKLRDHPLRQRDMVRIGCGAGFAGDRPSAALKLLKKIKRLHYMILECLAERTFVDRYEAMTAGGMGYDPRISMWMELLLPEAVKHGVCIITNMGAMDPLGAQNQVLKTATNLGLSIHVAIAHEIFGPNDVQGCSTYLGAAPIVHALEKGKPNVIITTRMADAALFLGPMIFELGWNWNDYQKLAQGTLAGHLLECGCQLTGGYFMHPADPHRNISSEVLLDVSLPYAEVNYAGDIIVAKAESSGGELSIATCTQQLLYEMDDPAAYVTPDVVINIKNVTFQPLTKDTVIVKGAEPSEGRSPDMLLRLEPMPCGWKGWGEISYGGPGCKERAATSDLLVRSWMEEAFPGSSSCILSYAIGHNSLHIQSIFLSETAGPEAPEVRLRLDGLFDSQMKAVRFTQEFEALYTNGPAGGGGISTGYKKGTSLNKRFVPRNEVFWQTRILSNICTATTIQSAPLKTLEALEQLDVESFESISPENKIFENNSPLLRPLPSGITVPLYQLAHGRTGDKGDRLNISLIPHIPSDLVRMQKVITKEWVKAVMGLLFANVYNAIQHQEPIAHLTYGTFAIPDPMLYLEVDIYELKGVSALNIVVNCVLDGGVNCSRRIDRHGKTLSDLFLCQVITLP
ncbi:hypothetical protein O6H91_23G068200 [Diphasiastrum complanatum]|nr:hypothetical protein O6H91_23G068200 [Diphasiastrum complanatum]